MSPGTRMVMWTVYDHPRDFPRHFVVRPWTIVQFFDEPLPGSQACLYDDLEQLRHDMRRRGLSRITRQPDDDERILEVWL